MPDLTTARRGSDANPAAVAVVDTREQLLHLLAEASEFEHNLLCCYLYAAFSLKRGRGSDGPSGAISETEAAAVDRWRKVIMSVAIEEMAHLVLVANLAVSVGGRAHLNRPNLPVSPGYHPAGIVIELAPFDMATLDHFIFLERPDDAAIADSEAFEPSADFVRTAHCPGALMPSAHDYETIAQFYRSIRRGFQVLAHELGEEALFVGNAAMQVGPDVVSMEGLATVTNLVSALSVIDTIVIQGEGSAADSDDSHFQRFQQIKIELEELCRLRPDFEPAHPAARNPVMRRPVDDTNERVLISSPRAVLVLDLANALYNHMLRLLSQSFNRSEDSAVVKGELINAAIDLMHVFGAISEYLATLPADENQAGINAGVSFAIFRATEPMSQNANERKLIAERFNELADGARSVCADVAHLRGCEGKLRSLASAFGESTCGPDSIRG